MYYRTLFVIALFAVSAFAQSSEMSLAEAVIYTLANNKSLQAERKQIDAATGRLKQAGLRANPMLEASGLSSLADTSMRAAAVLVRLPLEAGGRRLRRIEVAERELERMKYEIAERERELAAKVRTKYGETVEAMRNLELNERLLELNENSYHLIQARVTEGASAPLEQSQMQVEVGKIEANKQANASRVAVLLEEFKSLLGMGSEEQLKVRNEFSEIPVTMSRQELLALAFKTRPDLQAAHAAEAVTAALIEQAKTEGKYDMSIFAELGRQAFSFDQFGVNRDSGQPERVAMGSNTARVGVSITLPTRNKNQGNIEAAVALNDEARLRREFIETIIRREVAAAYVRYEGAQRVLKIYNTDLLVAAQNNLRVMRASFDLGHIRLTEVLNEQRRLIDVQMGYTAALKESFAARVELENVVGTTLEK